MTKQGKNVIVGKCEKCKGDLYMTHNGCCSTHYTCFDCGHFYEVDEYAAAETAATEYAQQAAELQEEVERLRGVVEDTIQHVKKIGPISGTSQDLCYMAKLRQILGLPKP